MEVYIHQFAQFLREHLNSISVGLIATFLMIYGSKINGYFKKITRSMPFLGRFILFIVLCSAGYGFVSSQLVRLLKHFLFAQKDMVMIGIISGLFVILAFCAHRGKDI